MKWREFNDFMKSSYNVAKEHLGGKALLGYVGVDGVKFPPYFEVVGGDVGCFDVVNEQSVYLNTDCSRKEPFIVIKVPKLSGEDAVFVLTAHKDSGFLVLWKQGVHQDKCDKQLRRFLSYVFEAFHVAGHFLGSDVELVEFYSPPYKRVKDRILRVFFDNDSKVVGFSYSKIWYNNDMALIEVTDELLHGKWLMLFVKC